MKYKLYVLILTIALIGIGSIAVFSVPVKVIDQIVNYPNPFDSRVEKTYISYTLEADAYVRMEIYDLLGYRVKEQTFRAGEPGGAQGRNRIAWQGDNEAGQKVAKGGYICRVYAEYADAYAFAVRKIGVIH